MKIAIANDHRGVERKNEICNELIKNGYEVINVGTDTEESVDYPVFAFALSKLVVSKEADLGILLCGTGIGMSIAANKVRGIRCARVTNVPDTVLCREHNNANVIAISSNMDFKETMDIVNSFIDTPFSNDERHVRRLNMVDSYNE